MDGLIKKRDVVVIVPTFREYRDFCFVIMRAGVAAKYNNTTGKMVTGKRIFYFASDIEDIRSKVFDESITLIGSIKLPTFFAMTDRLSSHDTEQIDLKYVLDEEAPNTTNE